VLPNRIGRSRRFGEAPNIASCLGHVLSHLGEFDEAFALLEEAAERRRRRPQIARQARIGGDSMDRGDAAQLAAVVTKEMGVARVVPMFPPEKADKVLPIVDRWTRIMQQVNG
jgi:hypothetical protein